MVPDEFDGSGREGRVGVKDAGENVTKCRSSDYDQVGGGVPTGFDGDFAIGDYPVRDGRADPDLVGTEPLRRGGEWPWAATRSEPTSEASVVSVGGWAGSDNLPGYFGYFGPELEQWINAELARPQLYLVGRRTYEMLAGLPAEALDESSNRMFATDKVVFSRTLDTVDWPDSRICHDDVVSHVEHLKTAGDVPVRRWVACRSPGNCSTLDWSIGYGS